MFDFLMVSTRSTKRGMIEIYPKFKVGKSSDLMIRGGDFYAVWIEERGLWSTDEQDVIDLIDRELDNYAKENSQRFDGHFRVLHMWDSETGIIDTWHKYCQRQQQDSFTMLDEKLIFSNTETNKKDYASKRLPYPLEKGNINAYEKLISTLYTEEERHKIEWAIGSIVSGDSKHLQKFMVLYGSAGTGKSTILNIIQQLFCFLTGQVFVAYINQNQMVVGTAGNQTEAFSLQAFGKSLGILDNVFCVLSEFRLQSFAKSNSLSSNNVFQWTTLQTREDRRIQFLSDIFIISQN